MKRLVLLSLVLAAPLSASASAASLKITEDTYLDNLTTTANGFTSTSTRNNYGGNLAIKATSNDGGTVTGQTGGQFSGALSLTHGLFKLPAGLWDQIGTFPIPAATPVTVTYNIRNNSLAKNPAKTTFRQLELHPLTENFVAGTGGAGSSDTSANNTNGTVVNGSPVYYGADWITTDGQTNWSTPGGAFDPTFVVTSPQITAATQTVATWNITDLLNDATTRAEIRNNGLLVRVSDETAYTGNEFASLRSASDPNGPSVSFTAVPEPTALGLFGGATLLLARRKRTS